MQAHTLHASIMSRLFQEQPDNNTFLSNRMRLTHPGYIKAQIPRAPLHFNSESNCYVVCRKQRDSIVHRQRRSRQSCGNLTKDGDITYIRLDFQVPENGRAGFKMMPTFAAPISFARIWASLVPAMVICMSVPCSVSNSFMRFQSGLQARLFLLLEASSAEQLSGCLH
jgi:hypothetical protein